MRKGSHLTEENKAKIRLALLGRHLPEETKSKLRIACKGWHKTEDAINKTRLAHIGMHHSEETKIKISIAHKGKRHPISEETRAKISVARLGHSVSEKVRSTLRAFHIGRKHTEDTKAKLRLISSGRHHTKETKIKLSKLMNSPKMRAKLSKKGKLLWQDPNYRDKVVAAVVRAIFIKPNKPELQLQAILNNTYPQEWKYTGNGKIIIGGRNPDFTNINGRKAVIELFGDYWHGERARCYKETEEGRINHFKQYGFACLIIWEKELQDENRLIHKIKKFMRYLPTGGAEIVEE